MKPVIATCATMPERLAAMHDVTAALLPQVDELRIYLNSFPCVQRCLDRPGVTLIRDSEAAGDLGDAGKFYGVESVEGYHFTVDDDAVYPPDYVTRTIEAIERHDGGALVSWHGKRLHGPIRSYVRDHDNMDRHGFWAGLGEDTPIDIPATGYMAYRTDRIRFTMDEIAPDNRSDMHVALACAARGYRLVSPTREVGWIVKSPRVDHARRSIYAITRKNDEAETRMANEVYRRLRG